MRNPGVVRAMTKDYSAGLTVGGSTKAYPAALLDSWHHTAEEAPDALAASPGDFSRRTG